MTLMTMVQAINSALRIEMEKNENVVLLGEDIGIDGGVFRVTEGLLQKFGSERVIDTPLSESGIIGTAIGMAVFGLRPVAEVQFSGFMYPGFEQTVSHAARIRNRSRGRYNCPLVIRTPFGAGIRALEHHQESTEAYYIHTPGLKVVMPSNPYDAKGLLFSSIRDNDPVIFFESLKLYRSIKMDVPEEEYSIELEKASIAKQGNDVTMISFGAMAKTCLDAIEELGKEKIDVELIDLRTLYPLDSKTIIDSVKKTGRAIIVHEAARTCGLGAEISAEINEKALYSLQAPVIRITGYDTVPPLGKQEMNFLPSVQRIIKETKNLMRM